MRRVAITGLGVICALGKRVDEFWEALVEARSGIQPIQAVDASGFRFHAGAEVRDFDPSHISATNSNSFSSASPSSPLSPAVKPLATHE